MEQPITAFFDEEWETLSKMFSSEDTADFMFQLHGHELFSSSNGCCDGSLLFETTPSSSFWPVHQASIENVAGVGESFLNHCAYDFQNISQESSYSSGGSDNNNLSHGFHLANDLNAFKLLNGSAESMDFCGMDEKNDNISAPVIPDGIMAHILCPREEIREKENAENQPARIANSGSEVQQLKRKFAKTEAAEEKLNINIDSVDEQPKKKSRAPRNAQKNKKTGQPKPKKNQKAAQIGKEDDQETNVAAQRNGQSSCSNYSSEDDSNASQESNPDNKEPALNLNGKARANRGSATDPQSLYARKRRERINERLRILQNLVPNGTKVDISTMLEEAVHYVKFLQLQIKLLSSDDMWMYAPIVYNGLDIGMYGRIFPTQ